MGTPLYDTNILIDHLQNETVELIGYTTILNLIEFPKAVALKSLDIIIPGKEDYDKGFQLALLLLKEGTPIPAIDIVIAAVTINRRLILHTRDKHFNYVKKIDQEFQVHLI